MISWKKDQTQGDVTMSEFMEVFTTIHLTYVCIIPGYFSIVGIILLAFSEVFTLYAGNLFLYFFVFLFMIMTFSKVLTTIGEASYIEHYMEKFQGIDDKLKSLEY